jgi:LmbE family N-acetylglucosaminyl deacetylase
MAGSPSFLENFDGVPRLSKAMAASLTDRQSADDFEQLVPQDRAGKALRVLCIGAHPDDAETGCGGTLTRLIETGHDVSIFYLTRGEAGLRTVDPGTAASIRSAESLRACELLGAQALFGGQIDAQTEANEEQSKAFADLIRSYAPDLVLTHWPVDTHRDHRNAALLTYRAWAETGRSFVLAFYEVMTGIQTLHFHPNVFVDVKDAEASKQAAVHAHECQNPARFYPYHVAMEKRRGAQAGLDRAEAFVVLQKNSSGLPDSVFAHSDLV